MFDTNRSHVTLHPGDPGFSFSPNGITVVYRAGIEIDENCPREYRQIIAACIDKGWLSPVAYMRDTEYTMELLKK